MMTNNIPLWSLCNYAEVTPKTVLIIQAPLLGPGVGPHLLTFSAGPQSVEGSAQSAGSLCQPITCCPGSWRMFRRFCQQLGRNIGFRV